MPSQGEQLTHFRLVAQAVRLCLEPGDRDPDQDGEQWAGQRHPEAVLTDPAGHAAGDRLASKSQRSAVGDRLQVGRQLGGGCVSIARLRGQAPPQDRLEGGGDRAGVVAGWRHARPPDLPEPERCIGGHG